MTFPTLMSRVSAFVLVTAALSFPIHPAVAQKAHAAAGDHDMQTLSSYRLTESSLRRFYKMMGELAKAATKDSSLQDAVDSNGSSNDEDIASMAAEYDRVPALKSALTAAGFTSTEFATFSLSYMQASMAYSMMTQGPENLRIKELPKGTPKENVDFVRTHQDLIQQLDKELKALQQPGSGSIDAAR